MARDTKALQVGAIKRRATFRDRPNVIDLARELDHARGQAQPAAWLLREHQSAQAIPQHAVVNSLRIVWLGARTGKLARAACAVSAASHGCTTALTTAGKIWKLGHVR